MLSISNPIQHAYCRDCATKFVAEQEDHKCPQCRMEYEGSPTDIKKSFFEVIEEEAPLYEQARNMIVGYLGKYNSALPSAVSS